MYMKETGLKIRTSEWLENKVLEQAAQIDALAAEVSQLEAAIKIQAARIAFLTPCQSEYIGGDE